MHYYILLIALLICAPFASAKETTTKEKLSGRAVMQMVEDQANIYPTQVLEVKMAVYEKKGSSPRIQQFTIKKKNTADKSMSLVRFFKPGDIKGTGLLSKRDKDTFDSHQWLYLPAFKTIQKLSGKDQNQSFFGSDFSKRDIAGRNINQDTHSLSRQDNEHYYVTSTPKSSEDPYSKLEYTIPKKSLVPQTIKFYDQQGKLLKILENHIEKKENFFMATASKMTNEQVHSYTILNIVNTDLHKTIPNTTFSPKGLKQ